MIASIAAAALLSTVTFATPPQETSAMLAGDCMSRGHQVLELTANQVKCEIALSREEQVNFLFIRFHQRRLGSSTLRQFISFTSVPTPAGTRVQSRMWLEASINSQVQTQEGENARNMSLVLDHLVSLGGTVSE